jgi:hypothetical protein
MARMREYTTFAERQAAYRARPRETLLPPLYMPALRPLWQIPNTGRWRMAIDLAARLLQTVAESMQTYAEERDDRWHQGQIAQQFHENLDTLNDLQAQLDDMRSSF